MDINHIRSLAYVIIAVLQSLSIILNTEKTQQINIIYYNIIMY